MNMNVRLFNEANYFLASTITSQAVFYVLLMHKHKDYNSR